jgi:hypothetical protein
MSGRGAVAFEARRYRAERLRVTNTMDAFAALRMSHQIKPGGDEPSDALRQNGFVFPPLHAVRGRGTMRSMVEGAPLPPRKSAVPLPRMAGQDEERAMHENAANSAA